jgi:hypothetical protein
VPYQGLDVCSEKKGIWIPSALNQAVKPLFTQEFQAAALCNALRGSAGFSFDGRLTQ